MRQGQENYCSTNEVYITNEIKHIAKFHVIILVSIEKEILREAPKGGSRFPESWGVFPPMQACKKQNYSGFSSLFYFGDRINIYSTVLLF